VVKMSIVFFWVVAPCSFVGNWQRFGRCIAEVKMKSVCFPEKFVTTCKSAWRHNRVDHYRQKGSRSSFIFAFDPFKNTRDFLNKKPHKSLLWGGLQSSINHVELHAHISHRVNCMSSHTV
jgi:hypothetical protein